MNKDVSKYFQYDPKTNRTIFTGDTLHMYFPKRYEANDLLTHTDMLHVLGICRMVINGTIEGGLLLAAIISIRPSETYTETIEEEPYLVAVLKKGDIFMDTNDVIQNDKLGYILWVEFIALGRIPPFITYENIHELFDKIAKLTGIKFPVNHVVFEMVYAHIYRDADNITKKYRHTPRKKPPVIVELRSIAYGPDTTIDKIVGSYSNDGLNSALVNYSDQSSATEIQLSS